jgi:hypothetical protein
MIPALVAAGVAIGVIIGLAIAGVYHASTTAPPPPPSISCIGLGNGKGGQFIDAYYARLLKPILEKMGREL